MNWLTDALAVLGSFASIGLLMAVLWLAGIGAGLQ